MIYCADKETIYIYTWYLVLLDTLWHLINVGYYYFSIN